MAMPCMVPPIHLHSQLPRGPYLPFPLEQNSISLQCPNQIQRSQEKRRTKRGEIDMASNLSPAFAYTVVYVRDVAKSVAFYTSAFGYNVRRLDQSHKWAELESGPTTIAFTPLHQRETDVLTGEVQMPDSKGERNPVEICFDYADVDAAYKRAVDNGALPVSSPEPKNWGQKVGYVRDIDGIVVRLGSSVNETTKTAS
ncbi:Dessication-induced 1VOC superfamily protein [Rhynchospora pubera]|uniref:Dessication-induced 1VOC superfamily protein n=1 Tax=Rhynchospora pubera TaxID=906938 RepID=A0AAV8D8F7_9POAL|nr:Dessication-induced 1VOC superfamily protein [Rhynchospora pubera]KAJ4816802.1 Dessication-induced 1VOC superfamily protein [Rhynchospora pubera]